MKLKTLTFTVSLLSTTAFADMPNDFKTGEVISASEVNENFSHNEAASNLAKLSADNASTIAIGAEEIAINATTDVSTLNNTVTPLLRVTSDNKEDILSLKNKHKSPFEAIVTYEPVTTNYGDTLTLTNSNGIEVNMEMTQAVFRKVNGDYYIARFPKNLGDSYSADTIKSQETIVQTINSGAEIDIHQSCHLVESDGFQSTCNYYAAMKVDTMNVNLFLTNDLVLFQQAIHYVSAIYSKKGAL